MTTPLDTPKPPMFANVSCSQCGRDFGPGYHGYSHCREHTEIPSPQESHKLAEELERITASQKLCASDGAAWLLQHRDAILAALREARK